MFISFDYDNDQDLRGNLVTQANDPKAPFNITDWSLREPISERWRSKVRDIICRTDLTIVICGEHTHEAAGVAAEVTIVREENKPYFLLRGRGSKTCTRPRTARRKDRMNKWTWSNLKRLIAEAD